MSSTPVQPDTFRFPFEEAERIFIDALTKRKLLRALDDFDLLDPRFVADAGLDATWIANSARAAGWPTRTPFAAVMCALLARSASSIVDPLSLQDRSGPFGYNAAGLWKDVIFKHGTGSISLNHLKAIPFNNSPFNGKRQLSANWDNVAKKSRLPLREAIDMASQVASYSCDEARTALASFVVACPDPPVALSPATGLPEPDLAFITLTLAEFAEGVSTFIALNSDGGRRAQAFVAACLEVAMPGRVWTPSSVNDPSRSQPGDVKSHPLGDREVFGPLYVEVKDKLIGADAVQSFIDEVHKHDRSGAVGYAAFANTSEAEAALPKQSRIPDPESLARKHGIGVAVWKSPIGLASQCTVWAGLSGPAFIWMCSQNFRRWLRHLDTGQARSPEKWDELLTTWGIPLDSPSTER